MYSKKIRYSMHLETAIKYIIIKILNSILQTCEVYIFTDIIKIMIQTESAKLNEIIRLLL